MHVTRIWFLSLLYIGIAAVPTTAGVSTDKVFSGGTPDASLIAGDSLALKTAFWRWTKVMQDTRLRSASSNTRAPDVMSSALDAFMFIWAENVGHDTDRIFRQPVTLGRSSVTPGTITAISPRLDSAVSYLRAADGPQGYACVFVDKNRAGRLYAVNGSDTLPVDASVTTKFSSLCHFDADTFLVLYRMANTRLLIVKVQSSPAGLIRRSVDTVARGGTTGDNIIFNPAITADSNGTILALWTIGRVDGVKKLDYKVLNRSFAVLDSGMLDDTVGSSRKVFYSEDAQAVSYARGKFAVVVWDTAGVVMHRLDRTSGFTISNQRLAANPLSRFPAISCNDTLLVAGWRGRIVDPARTGIECVRFAITNGVLASLPRDTFRLNADTTALSLPSPDQAGGELHMALDPGGSLGLAWMSPSVAYGAVVSNRPVSFSSGNWISPVISTGVPAGDSVVFYPDSLVWTGSSRDTCKILLRVIDTGNDTSAWMDSGTVAASQARGLIKSFQRTVRLSRDNGNLLSYPRITSISARWNAKPRCTLDSITVNGERQSINGFTLFPRFDTLRMYVRSHDNDADNRLTLTSNLGPVQQVLALTGATDYQTTVRYDPVTVTNTLIQCGVKVRDERGWLDSLGRIAVTVRNSVPRIQTTAILDTSRDNRKDTVFVSGTRANYSIQEGDSIYLRYSVTDTNDPAIRVRIKLIHGRDTLVVDSASGSAGRIYAVGSDLIADGDTRILRFEASDPDTTIRRDIVLGVNHTPVISGVTGGIREGSVADNTPLWMNVNRPARFAVTVNDPDVAVWDSIRYIIRGVTFADSVKTGATLCTLSCRATPADTLIRIIVRDLFNKSDTLSFAPVNHPPALLRVVVGNRDTVEDGDSARMIEGDTVSIQIAVGDSDIAYWDSITYRVSSITRSDSVLKADSQVVMRVVAGPGDTVVRIVIRDSYGRTDSLRFIPRHPWFWRDSATNPAYGMAKDSLRRVFSLIGGSGARDTVGIPIINSGNDSMSITRIRFKGKAGVDWMQVGLRSDTGLVVASSLPSTIPFTPIHLPSGGSTTIQVRVNADQLTKDGLVYDTLFIYTSDPRNPVDTIPVRLEYNDLPRLVSVGFLFDKTKPFPLAKAAAPVVYVRPPYSKIAVTFTEPMDTSTADSAVHAYSVLDSMARGGISPILFKRTWNASNTVLILTPVYTQPSTVLAGITPDTGFFIPTDSIRVVVNNTLADKALTPSAPNHLDIHRDFLRIARADTSFGFRIDSVTFKVVDVRPDSSMTGVTGRAPIEITFSSAPYRGTIDTARTNNRSLTISSRYLRGTPAGFDSVRIVGNRALLYPALRFFSGDSVYCWYHSATGRDSAGYPADIRRNGMPVSLFSDTATSGDLRWFYRIKPIRITSLTPAPRAVGQSVTSAVSITFSDPVPRSVFDTDTTALNRSFRVYSSYGGGKPLPFKRISFNADSTIVTMVPRFTYYSYDSIICRFIGFSTTFSYDSLVNLPQDTINVFGDSTWYFLTENSGCYTFPNPYKPGLDNRHCGTPGAPCGIWFKNLHTLRRGLTDVSIRIMNTNGFPVFDTRKSDIVIHFESEAKLQEPAWKWDARNQAGVPVASGYYYYAIYDLQNTMLTKGKLMIVR